MEEIWKDIKGFEELYQVSNLGRVKSLERTLTRKNGTPFYVKERILKTTNDHSGYPYVTLIILKKRVLKPVHRLVAEAFIPNPENKPCIDHIDCVRTNAQVENLRWVTHSENNLNPITVYRKQQSNCPIGKGLYVRPIIGTSIVDDSIICFSRMKDAQQSGFYPPYIRENIRGKRPHYKGYIWKYNKQNL